MYIENYPHLHLHGGMQLVIRQLEVVVKFPHEIIRKKNLKSLELYSYCKLLSDSRSNVYCFAQSYAKHLQSIIDLYT